MSVSLIAFLLGELKSLGIRDIFGVPGDYAFPIDDAIEADPELHWIGCCNELNAAYAADGYARMKGLSVLCTTFGVGELSAIAGIAGAYAEHLPVIHLVGIPASGSAAARRVLHHTLGTGKFHLYAKMCAPVVAASAILTPENAAAEIRRVLQAVLYEHRPGYLALPMDYAHAEIAAVSGRIPTAVSDPETLAEAVSRAQKMLDGARLPVVLPGYLIQRLKLENAVDDLLAAGNYPFGTMMMDKGVLNEHSPRFLGIYDGELLPGAVQQRVESADCILNLGAIWSDFNTGTFTARLPREKVIVAGLHQVAFADTVYHDVELADFVNALREKVRPHAAAATAAKARMPGFAAPSGKFYIDDFYRRLAGFLREGDILVADTGTPALAMSTALLPPDCMFVNQTLWGAIGWATPAAFGVALAMPERRVILLTGEGAHQLTAQEISQFHRHGLKVLVFVVNNGGYQIERMLDLNPDEKYNDLPQWDYQLFPRAMGDAGCLTGRITDSESARRLLAQLEHAGDGAYVEVVTAVDDVPSMMRRFGKFRGSLYAEHPAE